MRTPATLAAIFLASILSANADWEKLFNGKDLTNFGGAGKTEKNGYLVVDGVIESTPKCSNLMTEKQWADYILEFEFQLTPGANNGLGIHYPGKGNPAYTGMELQILDNTADKYKDLKPYQFHGSIYGVIPAIRGHQQPVGEWNFQEVRCEGRRVTITLNGHVIVDADLDVASRDGTLDGQAHPGLKRSSGHIGFLGHGSAVAFRNLRVRSLSGE